MGYGGILTKSKSVEQRGRLPISACGKELENFYDEK